MNPAIAARAILALLVQATATDAAMPFFLDPVTTYANGMPLATTEPVRDADTVRGCARGHLGCCGGKYQSPYQKSLFSPNRCEYHGPLVLDDRTPGGLLMIGQPTTPLGNGLEPARLVKLGPAPNVGADQQRGGGPDRLPSLRSQQALPGR